MRRGSGISGLGWLAREYVEHRDGRIGWWRHLYLFLDSAGRRKRLINWKKEPFELYSRDVVRSAFTRRNGVTSIRTGPTMGIGRTS
jgi:hypothetical protein